MEEMKARHKNVITKLKRHHSGVIQSKNDRLAEAEKLAEGLHELLNEMADEVHQSSKMSKKGKLDLIAAQAKASKAHSAYVEHKLLSNLLKDEARDAQLNEDSLRGQVEEYGEIIDYLSRELEEQEQEFDDILEFIDSCNDDNVGPAKPKVIAKHYVPNSRGKGGVFQCFPFILIYPLPNSLLYIDVTFDRETC